jgi:hypothetical protein
MALVLSHCLRTAHIIQHKEKKKPDPPTC